VQTYIRLHVGAIFEIIPSFNTGSVFNQPELVMKIKSIVESEVTTGTVEDSVPCTRASAVEERSNNSAEGTPPCNTVPLNYNPKTFKSLRYGIDSLYVSYPGVIAEDWDKKLANLKELAQSEDENQQALAQVVIGLHLFEVKDKGKGRFSYVLVDNSFYLQASNGRSKALPMAYVQISSEYLAHAGVEQAENSLQFIVNTLGLVKEPANISRADLFVDFCADLKMDSFNPLESWITRTQSIDLHYRYNRFSGWSFGMGGDINARLYDKTLEVEKKSKKFYLYKFWQAKGWHTSERLNVKY